MNNFKFTSKLRVFIAVSFVIIVLGMALGTVSHFVLGGFFNYDGEYESYKSVTVDYVYTEFNKAETVENICEGEFEKAGLKNYVKVSSGEGVSNEIEYRFSYKEDDAKLSAATDAINGGIAEATKDFNDIPQSRAVFGKEDAVFGGEKALSRAAIALAVIVAVHAIYTVIRHKLTAMCAAFAIDIHNIALFAAVLALCRIPVTSAVMTFAVFTSLATAVCLSLLFENIRRGRKDADNARLSAPEIVDASARKTFKTNLLFCALSAIASVLVFVFTAIGSLSLMTVISPAACALAAFAVSFYGSVMCAPSVYAFFDKICGKAASTPSQKKGK